MIAINDQDRVEVVRQARVITLSEDRLYLFELFALFALPHFIDRPLINVHCVYLPFSAHLSGEAKGEMSGAAANVRNSITRLHPQCSKHFGRPLPHIPFTVTFRFLRQSAYGYFINVTACLSSVANSAF